MNQRPNLGKRNKPVRHRSTEPQASDDSTRDGQITASMEKQFGLNSTPVELEKPSEESKPRSAFVPPLQARTFLMAGVSMALLWLAFPPIGLWWLAWLALVPLVWLVDLDALPGRRPYWQLWLAGLGYWLGTFYFIPYPHPILWLGWMAVSFYLAIYLPFSIGVARVMRNRWNVPSWLSFPIAITSAEWIRSHFATGMALVCLSHSQFRQPVLIQVADLSGGYTLTFLMAMFTALVSSLIRSKMIATFASSTFPTSRGNWFVQNRIRGAAAITILLFIVGYGTMRLGQIDRINLTSDTDNSQVNVAIIQGSLDKIFVAPTQEEVIKDLDHYRTLTLQALLQWDDLDLILWPESSFTLYDLISDYDQQFTAEQSQGHIQDFWLDLMMDTGSFETAMIVGGTTLDPQQEKFFNAAIWIGPGGRVIDRYYKIHRVLFGEYVPLGDQFPVIAAMTPLGRNLNAGRKFKSFAIEGIKFTPSICFETTVPHLMRRMVNDLAAEGAEPDVLINLTNDGWFFGTSCLDLHLACNVFRAVELRKHHLVCANTGFSADIDASGRLLQVGPRRDTGILRATVTKGQTAISPYRRLGDVIPALFGWGSLFLLVASAMRRSEASTD